MANATETSSLTPLSAVAPSRFLPLLKNSSRVQILETIHEEESEGDNMISEEVCSQVPSSPVSSFFSTACFLQVMDKPLPSCTRPTIACQYCA
ncbi:hypothetical protein D8674_002490 [Pyrus ussuriensis x Pyrus communis]|uniref:Uncharacterized protein n=1 Tax=Pyrus ussuriensis x Pyrus communis TaxID=2448454 RepID=A0A5N5FEH1_9ROSA|nr:hypothetical protein D8674_002490 [Pyrus ussuriensis x Pyrus communis]